MKFIVVIEFTILYYYNVNIYSVQKCQFVNEEIA